MPTPKPNTTHLIGHFIKHKQSVFRAAEKAKKEVTTLLKYKKPIDVVIFDAEYWDIHPKLPLTAQARVYYIDIKLCLYKNIHPITDIIVTYLPSTIHHECAHVIRYNTVGYGYTFLDTLIDEGIACYVERSLSPKHNMPYIAAHANENDYLKKAKRLFKELITSTLHNEWFFGKGKLPEWIGYRLGFMIVESFMKKNSKISVDKLVRMEAKEIWVGVG